MHSSLLRNYYIRYTFFLISSKTDAESMPPPWILIGLCLLWVMKARRANQWRTRGFVMKTRAAFRVDIAPEEKERPLLPRERSETISDSEARSRPWSSSRHQVAFEKWKTPDDPLSRPGIKISASEPWHPLAEINRVILSSPTSAATWLINPWFPNRFYVFSEISRVQLYHTLLYKIREI